MDQVIESRLEAAIDTSSQSEQESNPTIAIEANDDNIEDNDDSRNQNDNETRTITVPVNSVSLADSQGPMFEAGSPIALQYQLKTENGQVTYRVVQVNDLQSNEQNQSHVVPTPIGGTQGVTQAIIAHSSPFVTSNTSPASSSDGPFYVMMAPAQEIVTSHGTLTRKRSSSSDCNKNSRDEKRRATHNEVERRRRDKINNWIMKLSKIVPDCAQDHTKQGQSKGGILAKACEYITDLVNEKSKLTGIVKENERLSNELDIVRQQLMELKSENRKLKTILQRHEINLVDDTS